MLRFNGHGLPFDFAKRVTRHPGLAVNENYYYNYMLAYVFLCTEPWTLMRVWLVKETELGCFFELSQQSYRTTATTTLIRPKKLKSTKYYAKQECPNELLHKSTHMRTCDERLPKQKEHECTCKPKGTPDNKTAEQASYDNSARDHTQAHKQ